LQRKVATPWVVICLFVTMVVAGCARTADIPGGIAELAAIELGGQRQWVQIRGRHPDSPLLLWLHGGAGKSNRSDFDPATLTFEQFVAAVRDLTRYLRTRFADRPLILLGHSWGTQLGLTVAARYPEDYQAYIGVAQVVGRAHSQPVAHAWLHKQIEPTGNHRDLADLERLGPPPLSAHADYVRFANLLGKYGGNMDLPFRRLAAAALGAPEYTLLDYWRWLSGARRGSGPIRSLHHG